MVSIIRGNEVYVGWVGDSQAMLVRDHQPVEIMTPHKPGNEVSGWVLVYTDCMHWVTKDCNIYSLVFV